jgi:Holliday junction resolvasome RuvABC endonuclease subunit
MTTHQTILAISLKATRLGIAVLAGRHLIFYQMIGLGDNHTKRFEIARFKLQSLISIYHPQIVALETLIYTQQKNIFFRKLAEVIIRTAERNSVSVKTYSPNIVRSYFCQKEKPTKELVANLLIKQYPELKKFVRRQSIWQKFYAMLIFSSIALGLYCSNAVCEEEE